MTKYEFNNADEQQFYDSFTGYADILSEKMPAWVNNYGYPLVRLTMNINCDTLEFKLKQERILKVHNGSSMNTYSALIWNQDMIDATKNELWSIQGRLRFPNDYLNTGWFNTTTTNVK